jgi:mono/diheme cytochrome c family protein
MASRNRVFLVVAGCAFPLLGGLVSSRAAQPAPSSPVRFNRDIRPILSENCFACHGPDPANRKAGLRLDTREGLLEGNKDREAPVLAGNPAKSELYARITAEDPGERMPPAKSHKKLTDAQKELVRLWIEQGAPWEAHWSLVAPVRPPLPAVKAAAWVKNPIDRFILARLEAKGLTPLPEADRHTLIRRVTFDLTGLPPTPAEVEAFVNDPSADAYGKVVDRLLASKAWGEHRARYWLDYARYADTHGLHIDNYREIWPYRDWVIAAFNKNLPFDRFTIEQLAGDLLPNRTLEQQVATGFHRCNITTNEGGVIPDEVEAMYAKDRVETTASVWLGLTAGCASCHSHKFDPLTQKEFYQLVAFFRNTTQRPLDGNIADTPPVIVVPRMQDRTRWETLLKEIAATKAQHQKERGDAAAAFQKWLTSPAATAVKDPLDAGRLLAGIALHTGDGNEAVTVGGKAQTLTLPKDVSWGPGTAQGKALRFGAKAGVMVDGFAGFDTREAFTLALWILVPPADDNFEVLSKLDTKAKERMNGWALELNQRIPTLTLYGQAAQDKLLVRGNSSQRLKAGAWNHLVITHDGSGRPDGFAIYVDGKAQIVQRSDDPSLKGSIANQVPLTLGFAGRRDFKGGALQDVRLYGRLLGQEEIAVLARWPALQPLLAKHGKGLPPADTDVLLTLYLNREDQAYRTAAEKLSLAESEQRAIRLRGAVTHVMQEKVETMPLARILFRGQYDQPRDTVLPATPAALPPMPRHAPRNRLSFAQWLVSPEQPLTARVTVNRMWQEVFGAGLVRSSDDFGIMGENPSHPELLDWLAVEFRAKGWDVKRFYKMMVMSATYRQTARATAEALKKDPQNRLLSRGPRFRMDAETLRDFALAASGLLVKKVGGPSVKPYQPPGVWEAVAMYGSNTRFYKEDAGEGLYRRSMYTFWKRSAPPASMEILNAPSRENCTVKRERTNTPLQALVTMNDPQFVEAARFLAQRALKEAPGATDGRLDFITMHVVARTFEERERAVCARVLEKLLAHYQGRPEEAQKLIYTGASQPDAALAPAELAAWTVLVNQLMNLDEALNK